MKGTTDTSTILSPILFLTVSVPVISFRIPVRDCVNVRSTVEEDIRARPDQNRLFAIVLSRPVPKFLGLSKWP